MLVTTPPIPDVTALFPRAVGKVRATRRPRFSRAQVLEVDGSTRGGRPVATAAGIVSWRFVFDNQSTPRSPFRSATLVYDRRGFHAFRAYASPFLEDVVIPRAPRMTLAAAVRRLRRAGWHRRFANVTLRSPLGPGPSPTLYIFGLADGRYVGVNVRTGRVAELGG